MYFIENLWKSREVIHPSRARIPEDSQHELYKKMKRGLEASKINVNDNKMAQAACRRMSRMELQQHDPEVELVLQRYSKVNLSSCGDDKTLGGDSNEDASSVEDATIHYEHESEAHNEGHSQDSMEENEGDTSKAEANQKGHPAKAHASEYFFQGKSYPVPIQHEFHSIIFKFTNSFFFTGFILSVILLNTIILVVSTSYVVQVRVGWYFSVLDNVFLGIYIMEIVLKLYSWRQRFFKDGWNIMDFIIVVFNLGEFVLPLIIQNMRGFNGVAILRFLRVFRAVRAIRALRVLRTIRFLSNLQVIMGTVVHSMQSIGAIVAVITLFMYMFAVIGRGLYAADDPAHFGNLYLSFFTLFQLLTMDDWFEIYETVSKSNPDKWHVIIYLLLYIVVENLIFLNLFVAVLVDNFQLLITAKIIKKKMKASKVRPNDEEYLQAEEQMSTCTTDSEDDESKDRKDLNMYNPGLEEAQYKDLHKYFQLLAALEHNHQVITEQQHLLDQMVDICGDM